VLVNPGVSVSPPEVFKARKGSFNIPGRLEGPPATPAHLAEFLASRYNDLTEAAIFADAAGRTLVLDTSAANGLGGDVMLGLAGDTASGIAGNQLDVLAVSTQAVAGSGDLVLDRTALNHNLKPLERDGLLTITVDKNDRRSRLVRLTKRGEARLDESRSAWLEAQERFETAFGAGQAADLRQTLELVAALEFGERAADLPAA